jgi:carboxyl-terminal processing protease
MTYLGTNEVAELNLNLEQKLGGIGAALKRDEASHEIIVTAVLPNSPALKGGLQDGDRILKINGKALPQSNELSTAVKLLRGEPGSPVLVSVKRDGSEALLDIHLVRDVVRLSSVLGDHRKPDGAWDFMWDAGKGIGYIRLTQVGKPSPEEMKAALDDLTARGLRALILDLRNNPGGSLEEAIAVADLFVESGRIVTVKSRAGEQVFEAKAEGTFQGFPMAVLVNHSTASAAEIIAACLQDHHRAKMIGERTFGQGIVRSLIKLQGGAGALKLPVAVYYRPNGKEVNRYPGSADSDDWGVSPDAGFEVTLGDEESKQALIRRSERDRLVTRATPARESQDRQMQKALEWVLAQTGQK